LNTDREAINEIKSTSNKFRHKLISLLRGADNDNRIFKSYISILHYELERKYIYNRGERITFEVIVIERNPNKLETFKKYGCTYKVERGPVDPTTGQPTKETNIAITFSDKSGATKLSHTQSDGFDLDDLEAHPDFKSLSPTQQSNLEACYKEINPFKPTNLLATDTNDCIKMDNVRFISNTDKLCKGTIEILYKLRNVLFHGEIVPDKDTNKVYEPAYHVLNMLIQAL